MKTKEDKTLSDVYKEISAIYGEITDINYSSIGFKPPLSNIEKEAVITKIDIDKTLSEIEVIIKNEPKIKEDLWERGIILEKFDATPQAIYDFFENKIPFDVSKENELARSKHIEGLVNKFENRIIKEVQISPEDIKALENSELSSHIVGIDIDIKNLPPDFVNKNIDLLLNSPLFDGLNSHYLDERKGKIHITFKDKNYTPVEKLKLIMNSFKVQKCEYSRKSADGKELSYGEIRLKKSLGFNLKSGISKKDKIEFKLANFFKLQDAENSYFNVMEEKFDNIFNKSNGLDNTIFHKSEILEKLTTINNFKIDNFLSFPNNNFNVDETALGRIRETFEPFKLLNNENLIEQINNKDYGAISEMVDFGYKPSDEIVKNIASLDKLDVDAKVAILSSLKIEDPVYEINNAEHIINKSKDAENIKSFVAELDKISSNPEKLNNLFMEKEELMFKADFLPLTFKADPFLYDRAVEYLNEMHPKLNIELNSNNKGLEL